MLTASEYLARALKQVGVRHAFGVGGANIEDLYDAIHRTGHLKGVVAKHEFSAATMADGYARVRGPLGVVMATSGGGALNLVPALAEAYASCVPVLALVGQSPTSFDGRGAFQDASGAAGCIDAEALFATISVYCRRVVEPDELPTALYGALAATLSERPGPSVLLLPKDVQRAVVDPRASAFGRLPLVARRVPAADQVRAAVKLLSAARKVLVIAGDGVSRHNARSELSAFTDLIDAYVAVTPDGRDAFDNSDPRFVGVVGVMGHLSAIRHLRDADACVLVGTRAPCLARAGIEAELVCRPLVSVHFEPSFVRGSPHVELGGHVSAALQALADGLPRRVSPAVLPHVEECATNFLPGAGTGKLTVREVLQSISAGLPKDCNIFIDAGNVGASAVHWIRSPSRARFVVALGMAGMGYSFGAAIGAAFANGRRTFVLAGDGAFYMHGLEIHTALEHSLPITFILFNNNAHAMCFTREYLYYGGDYSYNVFQSSDLAAGLARMFPSLTVLPARTLPEINTGLRTVSTGPIVMSVDVDVREIPPFTAFLEAQKTIDENRRRAFG